MADELELFWVENNIPNLLRNFLLMKIILD